MEADYEITLEAIKRFTKSEVSQELFDKVYGKDAVKTEEEFKARLKSEIEENYAMNSDFKFFADFKKKLLETNKIDLPEEFLKRWLTEANKDNKEVTPEQIEKEFPLFLEDLRWQLISGKFVKENNIQVSQDEIKNAAKEYTRFQSAQYGMMNAEDKMVEQWAGEVLKNREELNRLYEMEESKKLIAFFKETIKLVETEVSMEKFNEMTEK